MQSSGSGTSRETVAAIIVAILVVAGILWVQSNGNNDGGEEVVAESAPPSLDAPATLDPAIRTDTLPNGLRYYIRSNDHPEERAELRLVVKAGAVLEDEDQHGLAHAVEHMAFRGTTRFPGRAIDEYLQSVGMRLGEDLNAFTGYDETTYDLTIPTDRRVLIDSGLTILADWAHAVTFDSTQARLEGSIVFEEWRSRRGAGQRLSDARDTVLLRGTRYAGRRIIGDTATLRRFDVGAMRRFYRDWYRPDLMAVIAVGDFDAVAVEKLLRRRFAEIPRSAVARPTPDVGTRREDGERISFLTDPEVAATRVAFWFPRTPNAVKTGGDFRRRLVERMGRIILHDRLEREAERAGSPLLSAGVSLRQPVRPVEAHVVGAVVADRRTAEGLATIAGVIGRLRRFGPRPSELAHARENLLDERREALSGVESADIADALVEHYLGGDPVQRAATEYTWTDRLLQGIGAREVAAFVDGLAAERAPTIVITTASHGSRAGQSRALLAAVDSAAADVADEQPDSLASLALMKRLPTPGVVASRRMLTKIDTHEWTLANGMRVLLKPTLFGDDEVSIRVAAPGGASLASKEDYPSAYMADNVIEATGAGDLSGGDISRLLDERSFSVSPTVTDERIEVSASGRRRDLEAMMQLTHLYFTTPREDADVFRRYRERLAAYARNRAEDPDEVFDDSVSATLRPGDLRGLHGTRGFVDAVDMEKAMHFWRARTANASNFTAVIVGDFELWQVSPLVERYLASLPAGSAERPGDVGLGRITSTVQRTIWRGVEPTAQIRILFGDRLPTTLESDAELDAVRDLLDLALQSRIREQLGGTYSVSVGVERRLGGEPSYTFTVDFTTAPEHVDSLASATLAEIDRLRTRGPTESEARKLREAAIRHDGDDEHGNSYWAGELIWHSLSGWSVESIADHAEDAERISVEMLKAASARYLDARRFVRVTRLPESAPLPDTTRRIR
jgi:zinc protease